MSKKFLKILGICVLVIMLPVFITVAAVCLAEDGNKGGNSTNPETPGTYTVDTYFGSQSAIEKTQDGVWKVTAVPTREFYNFTGIYVNEVAYAVENGVVVMDETQKAAFEKAVVEEKKQIVSLWNCIYDSIKVVIDQTIYSEEIVREEDEEYTYNPNTNALENTGIFSGFEGFNAQYFTTTYVAIRDVNAAETTEYTVEFTAEDKTETGDLSLKTILKKIAALGGELTPSETNQLNIVIAL